MTTDLVVTATAPSGAQAEDAAPYKGATRVEDGGDEEIGLRSRLKHTVHHVKTALKHHLDVVSDDHHQHRTSNHLSAALNLKEFFPDADHAQIKRLEGILVRDGKYLISEPATLKRFLATNIDCTRWKADLKRARLKKFTLQDLGILALVSLALLLSTPARGHINALAGFIILSDSLLMYTPTKHGQLLYVGAVASAIGKLFSGFFIDLYDPLLSFGIFVLCSAITVMLISELHNITDDSNPDTQFLVLQILSAFNVFFQSGIFASGVKFLHDHFRPAQYGRALTVFAIGGRLGSIASTVSVGQVASIPGSRWEDGSRVASYICFGALVPLLVIRLFFSHPATHLSAQTEDHYGPKAGTHDAPAPPRTMIRIGLPKCDAETRQRDWKHFVTALKRSVSWWQRRSFLLMVCTNAGMSVAIAWEGFEGLQSLFTSRALHIPSGFTTGSVTIMVHIGAITSLILGGWFVEKFTRPGQARFVLIMIAIACIAQLGLVGLVAEIEGAGITVPTPRYAPQARAVNFFIGLGLGYPFFVTVPKFAMNFGGKHSALVTQALSLFALAVCAIAHTIFGVFAARSWTTVVAILFLFTLAALIAMLLFDFFEWKTKHERKIAEIEHALAHLLSAQTAKIAKTALRRKSSSQPPEAQVGEFRDICPMESIPHGDDDGHLDKRHDATHVGLHYLWTAFTFSIAMTVIVAFFVSYYWAEDPNILFPP